MVLTFASLDLVAGGCGPGNTYWPAWPGQDCLAGAALRWWPSRLLKWGPAQAIIEGCRTVSQVR